MTFLVGRGSSRMAGHSDLSSSSSAKALPSQTHTHPTSGSDFDISESGDRDEKEKEEIAGSLAASPDISIDVSNALNQKMSDFSYILPPGSNDPMEMVDVKPNISVEFSDLLDMQQNALQSLQTFDVLVKPNGQAKFIDPRFQGQHSVWSKFTMHSDCYTCKICEAVNPNGCKRFTPPPSTTVAMRHMREKHPDVAKQVGEEERIRKENKGIVDRKRGATSSPHDTSQASPCSSTSDNPKPVKTPKQPKYTVTMAAMPTSSMENFDLSKVLNLNPSQIEVESMPMPVTMSTTCHAIVPVVQQGPRIDLEALKASQKAKGSYAKSQKIKDDIAQVLAVPQFPIQWLTHPTMKKLLQDMDPEVHLPSTSTDLYDALKEAKLKKVHQLQQIFESLPWRANISYHVFADDQNREYVCVMAHYMTTKGRNESSFLDVEQIREKDVKGAINDILEAYGLKSESVFKFLISGGFSTSVLDREDDFRDEFLEYHVLEKRIIDDLDLEKLQKELNNHQENLDAIKPIRSFEHLLELAIQTAVGTTSKNNGGLLMALKIAQKCRSSLYNLYLSKTCSNWTPFPKLTGWGSIVVILDKFLKFKQEILELAEKQNFELLTSTQIAFLDDLHQVFYPFLNVFSKIHSESNQGSMPISHIYSSVKYFIHALDSRMSDRKGDSKVMSFILSEQLKSRFSFIIDPNDAKFDILYLIAAILDPNFAHTVDQSMLDQASEDIYQMIRFKNQPHSPSVPELELPKGTNPFLQSMFQSCQKIDLQNDHGTSDANFMDPTRLAIKTYISYVQLLKNRGDAQLDVVKFWTRCDPNFAPLKGLAMEVLSIPSSTTKFSHKIDSILFRHKDDLKSGLLNDKLVVYLN